MDLLIHPAPFKRKPSLICSGFAVHIMFSWARKLSQGSDIPACCRPPLHSAHDFISSRSGCV